MSLPSGIVATATLLFAVIPLCARSQTATTIPLNSPKPKPAVPAKPVALDAPKVKTAAPEAKTIVDAPPPPSVAPVKSFAPTPVLDRILEQQIRSIATSSRSKVALYAWQLNTAKAVAIDADESVQTADATRLALLWEILRQVALGDTSWDEKLPGSGTPTLREATSRLAFAADSTAVDQLANRFSSKRVSEDMTTLGNTSSWTTPKATRPPASQHAFGQARTTPRQMVLLLQHIGMCDLDLPRQLHVNIIRGDAACKAAVGMLRNEIYLDVVPATLGATSQSGNIITKAGSASTTRSAVAIVAARTGPIVMAIYSYDNAPGTEQDRLLASISKAIVNAWSPGGTDGRTFDRPHLGVNWE
jgi:beta-lactamase class A